MYFIDIIDYRHVSEPLLHCYIVALKYYLDFSNDLVYLPEHILFYQKCVTKNKTKSRSIVFTRIETDISTLVLKCFTDFPGIIKALNIIKYLPTIALNSETSIKLSPLHLSV